MTNRVRFASIALAAGAALAIAACNDEPVPAGRDVAEMMPDTSAPVADADGVAPDAGETGVAEPTTLPPEEDQGT